ncbi:MAG: hypothetical protein HKN68_06445 [Saprospiraceae bacterium]|nr:hypothetical protein [Saprospiraceae bacterium]
MTREEKIEAYILGTLSESDHLAFEQEISGDESLQIEVENMRTLVMGIETFQLKNKLKDVALKIDQEKEEKQTKVVSLNRLKYLAIAASIIAIASFGVWFLPDAPTDELLVSDYFYTDPGLPTKMGVNDQYEFYEGMVSYKSGDYKAALERWEGLEGGIGLDTLTYYKSMAHLNEKNWSQFMEEINKLSDESPFAEKADWYRLQAFLEMEDYERAKIILPSIKREGVEDIQKFLESR